VHVGGLHPVLRHACRLTTQVPILKRDSVVKRKVGRREQKKAETAQRIALAGRKLIRAKGFDAVTTQEVAVEAGIPPGTLFGYISNKTDLLIIALVHEAMEFVATIPSRIPAAGSCKDRIMFVFEEMANYHGRDIEITRHFLRELAITLNSELTQRSHGLGDAVRDITSAIVAEHQQRGEVTRELSASEISRLLFSHYWSSLRYWATGIYSREEFTTTLRKALRWQFMGIAATPASPAAATGSTKARSR
jgi:AcrR family transcriptional regulator